MCEPFDDGKERGYKFKAMGTYRRLGVPALESLVNVGGGPNGIWQWDVCEALPFEGISMAS